MAAHILVADADAAFLRVVGACLRAAGYGVVAAATPAGALLALAGGVDAVLADAGLGGATPPPDPWAALDRLRAAAGGAPVTIMAGAPVLFAGYAARGYAGLLAKPFGPAELLAALAPPDEHA